MLRRHRHVVVDALERGIGAAIVDADDRGPPHDAAIGQAFEFGLGGRDPFERGTAIDLAALSEEAAAEPEIFLAQDHSRAGTARPPVPPPRPAAPPPMTSTSQKAFAFS